MDMLYIGKLNEKCSAIDYEVFKKGKKDIPKLKENGNPFFGEQLFISWKELLETGVDIHITLDCKYLINEVVLKLGEKSSPKKITIYTENKGRELFCYVGETGCNIKSKEIILPIETEEKSFVIEIDTEFSDIVIEDIAIYGSTLSGEKIFPTPKEYKFIRNEHILVSDLCTYECENEFAKDASYILKEKCEELTGICLTHKKDGTIQLQKDASIPENGYWLSVTTTNVVIKASDLRGMVYGIEVFLKLISEGKIPTCEICDKPRMSFRGVHLMLPHPDQFEFAKRFVKYVLSPMGYNMIIMELAGGMEFQSHPEINRAVEEAFVKGAKGEWPLFPHKEAGMGKTVKQETMKDFVRYCRSFGIDVIPEIQSLGHVQFMTIAHPDIAERPEKEEEKEKIDERQADIPPNEFYGHSYCPSNPRSYEILFDLIDEIIEVFQPREYIHMGHDEVYQIGVCPVCKDKNPAELFAQDINRIYEYLKTKGLKMMIWADMLQPVTKYKTWAALDMIPKDILLLDFIWYFHMDKDIEDHLLSKGFQVVLGNMYSSHYPRYENRITKEGVVGAQVSSWVITSEDVMAREGKLYEFLYSGQMLWSENYEQHARYSYDKILSEKMPKLREQLGNIKYPSMRKNAKKEILVDNGDYEPEISLCGEVYRLKCKVDSLIFEHTATEKITRIPWVELDEIGRYVVTYTNGSIVNIPVTYTGNVGFWNRRHNEPFKAPYYRHNGYQGVSYYTEGVEKRDSKNTFMTMYCYEWVNPHPDQEIETVEYVKNRSYQTDVFLSRMFGVK